MYMALFLISILLTYIAVILKNINKQEVIFFLTHIKQIYIAFEKRPSINFASNSLFHIHIIFSIIYLGKNSIAI